MQPVRIRRIVRIIHILCIDHDIAGLDLPIINISDHLIRSFLIIGLPALQARNQRTILAVLQGIIQLQHGGSGYGDLADQTGLVDDTLNPAIAGTYLYVAILVKRLTQLVIIGLNLQRIQGYVRYVCFRHRSGSEYGYGKKKYDCKKSTPNSFCHE